MKVHSRSSFVKRDSSDFTKQLKSLLHYAHLAPSTRNLQPWSFEIKENTIHIHCINFARDYVDTDHRELYISIGCALENLTIAAKHFGLSYEIFFHQDSVSLLFKKGTPSPQELFYSIEKRHTSLSPFENGILTPSQKKSFFELPKDERTLLSSDPSLIERMCKLALTSDILQHTSQEFIQEVKEHSLTSLHIIPALLDKLHQFASFAMGTASYPHTNALLFGVIYGEETTKSWIESGQKLERLYLTATQCNLKLKPVARLTSHLPTRNNLPPHPCFVPHIAFFIGIASDMPTFNPRKSLPIKIC